MEALKVIVSSMELGRLCGQALNSRHYYDLLDVFVKGHLDNVDFDDQEGARREAYERYRFDQGVLESLRGNGTVRLRHSTEDSSRPELRIEPSEGGIIWTDQSSIGRGRLVSRLLASLYPGREHRGQALIRRTLRSGQDVIFQT